MARHCPDPECKADMREVYVHLANDPSPAFASMVKTIFRIWQCPECKTIEVTQ